jgi:hypothetical protein
MLVLVRDIELRGFLGPKPSTYKLYSSLRPISHQVKGIVERDPDGLASCRKATGIRARDLAYSPGSEAN